MAGGGALRVLVSLRSDGSTKPGGDVNLLRSFAEELSHHHRVETTIGVPSVADLARHDVVLTANLDRPIEPAATLARAERAGTALVLYALHHPAAGVEAYLRSGVHGVRRSLGRLAGRSPVRYEQLLWTVHAGSQLVRQRRLPALGSVARAQKDLLARAAVVVSSESEAAAITADIGPLGDHDVVAHPTDFPPGARDPVPGRVVVPGRIESRKNQLLALAVAQRFPDHRFLFVGGINPSDGRFGRRFAERLASTTNACHIEHLPRDDFYPLLLTAEAILSASWFEVTSLIEQYGAANGIPMAVSEHSYLEDGGSIHRFDPDDVGAAARALHAALTHPAAEPRSPSAGVGVGSVGSAGSATMAGRGIVEAIDAAARRAGS